jgi:glycosyltransferase involved in cell wall biosynthesis
LIRDLVPSEKIAMIYNSVDFSRAEEREASASSFRRKYGIPLGRKIVTQVSWMIPEKGIQDLLRVMELVAQQTKEVQLVLVGEGSHQSEFERLAQELGISQQVTFTGRIQDPMAEGVYAAADVVCQLSRWQEVFGYVIAEAMAFGKPVLASDTGGIPELVEDGVTGFLIQRGNYRGAAEKLIMLLSNADLRKTMGTTASHRALQKFDLRRNVRQLIELYGISPSSVPL